MNQLSQSNTRLIIALFVASCLCLAVVMSGCSNNDVTQTSKEPEPASEPETASNTEDTNPLPEASEEDPNTGQSGRDSLLSYNDTLHGLAFKAGDSIAIEGPEGSTYESWPTDENLGYVFGIGEASSAWNRDATLRPENMLNMDFTKARVAISTNLGALSSDALQHSGQISQSSQTFGDSYGFKVLENGGIEGNFVYAALTFEVINPSYETRVISPLLSGNFIFFSNSDGGLHSVSQVPIWINTWNNPDMTANDYYANKMEVYLGPSETREVTVISVISRQALGDGLLACTFVSDESKPGDIITHGFALENPAWV